MLLLTIDRVLLVRLNLRYPLFMSMKKILLSTSGIFLLGGIYFAVIISSPSGISNIYLFHAVTSLTFLVFVFLAYLWIIRSVSTPSKKLHGIKGSSLKASFKNHNQQKVEVQIRSHRLRRTTLTVPLLIVVTFVIFWVIPLQISYWTTSSVNNAPHLLLHPLGFISDAIIYIFFYPATFKELKKMLGILTNANN